ncbi:Hacd2 [Scenedesmus sp. PABB004]|nr:Hacd2 [Scenedesmus sp. PABB004]
MAHQRPHHNPHPAVKGYLVLYNLAQAAGWSLCLAALAAAAARGEDVRGQFAAGAPYARWLQFAAFAEILHAGTGIVPSSPISNFWQWLGRANALFKFAVGIPELQSDPCAVVMLACWSIGEMIRYPWYALTLLDACPHWLTWLRYTAFLALYPAGVVAEMALLWRGVPLVRTRGLYSVALPNAWNWAWDYARFIEVMLVLYPYLWWGNFSSLLRQRGKRLGRGGAGAAAAAAGARAKEE